MGEGCVQTCAAYLVDVFQIIITLPPISSMFPEVVTLIGASAARGARMHPARHPTHHQISWAH